MKKRNYDKYTMISVPIFMILLIIVIYILEEKVFIWNNVINIIYNSLFVLLIISLIILALTSLHMAFKNKYLLKYKLEYDNFKDLYKTLKTKLIEDGYEVKEKDNIYIFNKKIKKKLYLIILCDTKALCNIDLTNIDNILKEYKNKKIEICKIYSVNDINYEIYNKEIIRKEKNIFQIGISFNQEDKHIMIKNKESFYFKDYILDILKVNINKPYDRIKTINVIGKFILCALIFYTFTLIPLIIIHINDNTKYDKPIYYLIKNSDILKSNYGNFKISSGVYRNVYEDKIGKYQYFVIKGDKKQDKIKIYYNWEYSYYIYAYQIKDNIVYENDNIKWNKESLIEETDYYKVYKPNRFISSYVVFINNRKDKNIAYLSFNEEPLLLMDNDYIYITGYRGEYSTSVKKCFEFDKEKEVLKEINCK